MSMIPVIPPGSSAPIVPSSPEAIADNVLYVTYTLPLDADNNMVHVGDPAAQTRHVFEVIQRMVKPDLFAKFARIAHISLAR